MKKEEIEKLAERGLHPGLIDQLVFWQDRSANIDLFQKIEDLWALQYWQKYRSLRKVGFGKITTILLLIKLMK